MKKNPFILISILLSVLTVLPAAAGGKKETTDASLRFNPEKYELRSVVYNGKTVQYRAYENIVYVSKPVDTKYESMNIYIPAEYFENRTVNGYSAKTAPIFFPNGVGGYMPAEPGTLASPFGNTDTPGASLTALADGLVVAAPGARGRTTKDASGSYTGKAPACIADLKAAVRYLRYNDKNMPGDAEKIISNGTSAGGALSALLGSSGNSKEYEPYLKAIGAANARDDIYAASCYCPITNLEHADAAYEWVFNGHNDYSKMLITQMTDYHIERKEIQGTLSAGQMQASGDLASLFPAYVNSLMLKAPDGTALTLNADGSGSFREYAASFIIASAQKQLDSGTDMSKYTFLTVSGNTVTGIDFNAYISYIVRMKLPGAFDSPAADNAENSLFGDTATDTKHFTAYALENDTAGAPMTDAALIRIMNPMNYIGAAGAKTAPYWRIRHGTKDRDTSLAVPVILAAELRNKGFSVDFSMPWDIPHSGDYDLGELFSWIHSITK